MISFCTFRLLRSCAEESANKKECKREAQAREHDTHLEKLQSPKWIDMWKNHQQLYPLHQ